MKKLLILLLLPFNLFATDYYVSNAGNNSSNGLTTGTSWATMSKVQTVINNGTIQANDRILFKCGDTFTGSISINTGANNGSAGNPITLGNYGTGARPVFLYPTGTPPYSPDSRIILYMVGVNYYTIDGINFSDNDHTVDKVDPSESNCGFAIYLGDYGSDPVNNIVVRNVDIQYCSMGIVCWGSNCTFEFITMDHFKNLVSTSGGGGEDYGANPFTMSGDNNIIQNCVIRDGWAESLDFGYNGGFCEMIGACSNNQILRNWIYDTNGISEFGNYDLTMDNNVYAYNVFIDCGAMFWANSSANVSNTKFYNNTVIETDNSRFSQGSSNSGAGVVTAEAIGNLNVDQYIFGVQSQAATTVYDVRNNIFQIAQGGSPDMVLTNGGSKTAHTYNIFKLTGISGGYTTGTGESTTSAALFVATSGSASTWNYNLIAGSPAIGAGTTISGGLTTDIVGNPIGSPPNLGAYGPIPATTTNTIRFPVRVNGTLYRSIQ